MQHITPSPDELRQCFELELDYAHDSKEWSDHGFFLPGTKFEVYEQILREGYVRATRSRDGAIASFVLAVPPGHTIVERLVLNNEAMILLGEEHELHSASTAWVAKIATRRSAKRQGLAAELYRSLFKEFSGSAVVTATALSPLRNIPSEQFHRAMGMRAIGVFLSGTKGPLQNTVNIVWRK